MYSLMINYLLGAQYSKIDYSSEHYYFNNQKLQASWLI